MFIHTIMKDKIQTYVQLSKGYVVLNISITDDLKRQKGNLKNFGYFEITDGTINKESIFWDNLTFFLKASEEEVLKEIEKELLENGYKPKKILKQVNRLLKRAKKLKLLK